MIGEIKAMSQSRVESALGVLTDGTMQMSFDWLSRYADLLVQGILQAVFNMAGGPTPEPLKIIQAALRRGQFDLYLLRAKLTLGLGWKLKGYPLLHVTGNDAQVDMGVGTPVTRFSKLILRRGIGPRPPSNARLAMVAA